MHGKLQKVCSDFSYILQNYGGIVPKFYDINIQMDQLIKIVIAGGSL